MTTTDTTVVLLVCPRPWEFELIRHPRVRAAILAAAESFARQARALA